MILVDTSVWIEYLRDNDHPVVLELDALIQDSADLATTEPIIMELLAGANNARRERAITSLTNGLILLPVEPSLDYHAAASLFVAARQMGRSIRSLNDCLIAAVAVRTRIPLLHKDRDFDELAAVTSLRLHQPR